MREKGNEKQPYKNKVVRLEKSITLRGFYGSVWKGECGEDLRFSWNEIEESGQERGWIRFCLN